MNEVVKIRNSGSGFTLLTDQSVNLEFPQNEAPGRQLSNA